MRVFAVVDYDYSNTDIVGVFSSKEGAEEFVSKTSAEYSIEEYEVDELLNDVCNQPVRNKVFFAFFICVKSNDPFNPSVTKGTIRLTGNRRINLNNVHQTIIEESSNYAFWYFVPISKGENTARKIAAEKYQEYIRLQALGMDYKQILDIVA